MKTIPLRHLRRTLRHWEAENTLVLDAAHAINLDRVRLLAPIVALLNAMHAAVFLWLLLNSPANDPAHRWKLGLLIAHVCMGLVMAASAAATFRLRSHASSGWGQRAPTLVMALGMLFAIVIVTVDQWVTPNITPFLITCMIASLVTYWRPTTAARFYLLTYAGFFVALGLTQIQPDFLLSNRLNGSVACALGWALSVLLWRKFATITLQQSQLEKANALLQAHQIELERLTRLDGLTGLFNRNTFVELARQELARSQRQGGATAILLLDLDYFKRVNDTWGHPAGDAVLKHVAAVAGAAVRSTDLVGRLGGEEFIVLLPHTSVQAARTLAEKLRQRLEASPTPWENTTIPVTASIGLAGTTAEQRRDFEALYSDADKALYQAKQSGRNRVV